MKIGNTLDFDELVVQMSSIPSELAILPVNDAVVFPLMMVPLILRDPNLLRLADEALAEHKIIGAFTQQNQVFVGVRSWRACASWSIRRLRANMSNFAKRPQLVSKEPSCTPPELQAKKKHRTMIMFNITTFPGFMPDPSILIKLIKIKLLGFYI